MTDEFVTTTIHELRNPLTAIVGFSRLLADQWEQIPVADRQELAARIHDQARRLTAILDDLSVFVAARDGDLDLAVAGCELGDAVADAVAHGGLEPADAAVQVPENLVVEADRHRLIQVLARLIVTARTVGSPPFTIDAHTSGDHVEIELTDSGPGLPDTVVDRVFEPFAPLPPAPGVSGGPPATGLDAAIARALVIALGGDLQADRSPAGRTTFRVALPISRVAQRGSEEDSGTGEPAPEPLAVAEVSGPAPSTSSSSSSSPQSGAPRRPAALVPAGSSTGRSAVLVADDDRAVRDLIRSHLERQGYEVIEAASGDAALDVFASRSLELAIIDVKMPGRDGFELLTDIKADLDMARVPVVVVTGRTLTSDVVNALGLGAHDYLRKPFEPAELLARVEAALQIKRLQDDLRRQNAELETTIRLDALTGVFNRRHLDEQLRAQAAGMRRRHSSLAVLMIDIDHLKERNDRHGHAAGDAALQAVARMLDTCARTEDIVGRWGGDEFVVILPNAEQSGGVSYAKRLLAAVADVDPSDCGGADPPLTLSIGVAVATDPDPEAVLQQADEALYRAKVGGRNQFVVY